MLSWGEAAGTFQRRTLAKADLNQLGLVQTDLLAELVDAVDAADRRVAELEAFSDPITSGSVAGASTHALLDLFTQMENMGR